MPFCKDRIYAANESPFERLPSELLHEILLLVSSPPVSEAQDSIAQHLPGMSLVFLKFCTGSAYYKTTVDLNVKPTLWPCLLSCLLASRTLKCVGLPVMYRQVNICELSNLTKVLNSIRENPILGTSVRKVDLSDFCSTVPSRIDDPVLDLLTGTPLLREFRANDQIQSLLSSKVLRKLFCSLSHIERLDLSGCNSSTFTEACSEAICGDLETTPTLMSLNLAGCNTFSPGFFEALLPQLPVLQHLDLSSTQISVNALSSIPATARLTHLNISHCYNLDGPGTVEFLTKHPATKALVYLNVEANQTLEERCLSEKDISRLLAHLPMTLKTLNLKGSAMTSTHVPLLSPLMAQLDEICLGAHLKLSDIEQSIFKAPGPEIQGQEPGSHEEETEEMESKYETILTPMEEAIAICKLRQRINSGPEGPSQSSLKYLDISSLPVMEQGRIRTSVLLGPQSRPLEVIEVSEKVMRKFGILNKVCKAVGWEVKSVGRRYWLRRVIT